MIVVEDQRVSERNRDRNHASTGPMTAWALVCAFPAITEAPDHWMCAYASGGKHFTLGQTGLFALLATSNMLSEDSDNESLHKLTINEHYAKAYEYRKEREELVKCKLQKCSFSYFDPYIVFII